MKTAPALLLVLLAAACTPPAGKYPSLALRPIESRSDAEPVAPAVEATPDAALDAQVTAIGTKLAAIDADFTTHAGRAETAAKASGSRTMGSDAWLQAQSLLAEAEGLRGDTQGVVADLEKMVTDRGTAGAPPYAALDALHDKAQAQYEAEDSRIAAIKTSLGD